MAEASIPVDLFNPGQVFACLGFLEAAEILLGDAEGGFDWSDPTNVRFQIKAKGQENPILAALGLIRNASVKWVSHDPNCTERDGGPTVFEYKKSMSRLPKAADLPGYLKYSRQDHNYEIPIGFWADGTGRFHTTFKKSTNGASAHIRLKNAQAALRKLMNSESIMDPFNQGMETDSLFRIDPRGYSNPIDAGTSPDKLRKGSIDVRVKTYPICEVMAIIGLENSRPFLENSNLFSYYAWGKSNRGTWEANINQPGSCLPISLARVAIGCPLNWLKMRKFKVHHEEVKSGGDRKITSIHEEPPYE